MNSSWWHLRRAREVLQGGGVVAHATEGVWGLACDPENAAAVARVLSLKSRDVGKGLILIGQDAQVFAAELACLDASQRQRAIDTWPAAATFVVPNPPAAPWPVWVTGDHQGVAVRVPGHRQARQLCASFGAALVSTSANPGGLPAALTELKVRTYFGQNVDYYLPGKVLTPGQPSSIDDFSGNRTLRARAASVDASDRDSMKAGV